MSTRTYFEQIAHRLQNGELSETTAADLLNPNIGPWAPPSSGAEVAPEDDIVADMSRPATNASAAEKLAYANRRYAHRNQPSSPDADFEPADVGMTREQFSALRPGRRLAYINRWMQERRVQE